jgi:hypothetical protein
MCRQVIIVYEFHFRRVKGVIENICYRKGWSLIDWGPLRSETWAFGIRKEHFSFFLRWISLCCPGWPGLPDPRPSVTEIIGIFHCAQQEQISFSRKPELLTPWWICRLCGQHSWPDVKELLNFSRDLALCVKSQNDWSNLLNKSDFSGDCTFLKSVFVLTAESWAFHLRGITWQKKE